MRVKGDWSLVRVGRLVINALMRVGKLVIGEGWEIGPR